MYSIEEGKPRKVHYGNTVEKVTLDEIGAAHKAGNLTNEALFWKYHALAWEGFEYPDKLDQQQLWKKLTQVQKVVLTMGHFIGQVNNGGLWQLYFNQPMFGYAAYEALRLINTWALETKYSNTLKEFQNMVSAGHYTRIVDQIEAPNTSEEERWQLFQSGRDYIPSAAVFDDYFYEEEPKNYFYEKLIQYINAHTAKLFHILVPKDAAVHRAIPKKEAVAYFTAYLKEQYGKEPESVSIYYTGRVTIENQATQLFLMRYKLSEEWESIGITGFFTHHFPDVHWDEINDMYKKYHKQELVNLYHGWYLVEKAYQKDPSIFDIDQAAWQEVLTQIQGSQGGQIPVNVSLKAALRYDDQQWYFYEGDLFRKSQNQALPDDLTQVDMEQYRGERNLLFSTNVEHLPDFGGRMAKHQPVTSKYRPQEVIGKQYKLLKDNPWGF